MPESRRIRRCGARMMLAPPRHASVSTPGGRITCDGSSFRRPVQKMPRHLRDDRRPSASRNPSRLHPLRGCRTTRDSETDGRPRVLVGEWRNCPVFTPNGEALRRIAETVRCSRVLVRITRAFGTVGRSPLSVRDYARRLKPMEEWRTVGYSPLSAALTRKRLSNLADMRRSRACAQA